MILNSMIPTNVSNRRKKRNKEGVRVPSLEARRVPWKDERRRSYRVARIGFARPDKKQTNSGQFQIARKCTEVALIIINGPPRQTQQ